MIAEVQATGEAVKSSRQFEPDRLIMPLINEAALCLQEHIASPSDIDLAMVAGTGMTYGGERIGPLAVADSLGLDMVVAKLEALQQAYGDRFQPARLLRTKVRAGHLGRKCGRGFHEYSS
jgi:3-hydroxyacyl-CoA dehydrogenase